MDRTLLLVRREIADAFRGNWFAAYAGIFLIAGLFLAAFGVGDAAIHGYRGFAKVFAGLVHLALLFVPLMALFPATAAIAGERETGALEYLLAQPVSFREVYVGKWAGTAAAVVLALTTGFVFTATIALLEGVPLALIGILYGFVVLLALGFIALGVALSSVAGSRTRATTFGIVTWLVLVALGTLGLMISFVRWGLPSSTLVAWTFIDPIEAFRLGVVAVLDPDLSLLGPVGAKIVGTLGTGGTVAAAAGTMLVWAVVPGLMGWLAFRRGT